MTLSLRRRGLTALAAFALVGTLVATGAAPALADHLTVDDGGGLVVVEGAAAGGDAAAFTVTMNADPGVETTVTVSKTDPDGRVQLSTTSLTFNTGDLGPKPVTVTAVDDDVAYPDGDITIDLAIGGTSHGSFTVAVEDDDTADITVTPTSDLETTEAGGTATFTVVLTSQPTASVEIPVTDHAEATTDSGGTLTFTTGNWNVAQEVIVTGVDDDIDDGPQEFTIELGTPTSADGTYAAIDPADVTGTNLDDDTAGITVTPTAGLETTEAGGGTATFTIVLDSEPTADVVIGIASSDETEATVDPDSVTFTPGNWDTARVVTVTGVDDGIVDGDQAFTIQVAAPTSADTTYAAIDPTDVTGTNLDNDVPAPAPTPDPEPAFDDLVGLDGETVQAIEALAALGITLGTSDGSFSPHGVVSRWQMALFLSRQLTVHEITLPDSSTSAFTDLGGHSHAAQTAIAQIAALEVTSGTSASTYSPDQGVTRWQMALFMSRVLDLVGVELPTSPTDEFTDIDGVSGDAQVAIRQLAALGIVTGVGNGEFQPNGLVTRWQMALFIVRTLEAAGVSIS